MKKAVFALLLPLTLGAFAVGTGRGPALRAMLASHRMDSRVNSASGTVAPRMNARAERAANRKTDIRRRLETASVGTYISEMLLARDSSLARWPDRAAHPLTVWVQQAPEIGGWSPTLNTRVREAFEQWNSVGLPVSFSFVDDSATAEVLLTWTPLFREPISGRTKWARDDDWWITDANITLAVYHHGGDPLDEDAVKAMALHEIGHLLGLDHTFDTASIMAAKVRVRALSAADRATARLLYTLPPGAVR